MNSNGTAFINVPTSLCMLVNRVWSLNLAVCQDTASRQPDIAYGECSTVVTLSALKILKDWTCHDIWVSRSKQCWSLDDKTPPQPTYTRRILRSRRMLLFPVFATDMKKEPLC